MESLQKQILLVSAKIDALHQMVEQLSYKVSEVLADPNSASDRNSSLENLGTTYHAFQKRNGLDAALEHKDVITDGSHLDAVRQTGEKQLAPEVQIQRLTAQVTAAYNRIADLEERLLAQRIH